MTNQLLASARLLEQQADTCRLDLIRHGTTTLNVENRYRGRRDIPLDAQGYQDAVDAARHLSRARLNAVYTGPLRRTIATAQIIADEARVPDIRILHGLNNVDYGAWEGMTADEARDLRTRGICLVPDVARPGRLPAGRAAERRPAADDRRSPAHRGPGTPARRRRRSLTR